MAEDEDALSSKISFQNSENQESSQVREPSSTKPDLGIDEEKYDRDDTSPTDSKKSPGTTRKDENPFSFRHFLKRDLSLPGNSTYENTGARPKVYANTVQHSPTKLDVHVETRRDKIRSIYTQAKEMSSNGSNHRASDNTSSSSSVDIPFTNVVDNSDSKHNLYKENSEMPFYHRPNLASEPLGMPSLPDFVQDHLLVEQAYLYSNGPISVDLDNLPDFTFNTNFNAGPSSSRNSNNSQNRNYIIGAASASSNCGSGGEVPLDLPAGAEAAGPIPHDLPAHLSLDLTDSVNGNRRNMSPSSTFPLDLPPNVAAEAMRLPDFLPVHPGRTSPEPEHQDEQLRQILSELERARSELVQERGRCARLEGELVAARREAADLRTRLDTERRERRHCATDQPPPEEAASHPMRAADAESTIAKLKKEIKRLKEEACAWEGEARALRGVQTRASQDLRRASAVAETSLRDLLAGLEQLKTLSSALEPT